MITREMIKEGLENGLISVENEYGGCVSLCCRIGKESFYFMGNEGEELTVEEYWKSYTLDMTTDMLYSILKDVKSAEENGLDVAELGYYEAVLLVASNEEKKGRE